MYRDRRHVFGYRCFYPIRGQPTDHRFSVERRFGIFCPKSLVVHTGDGKIKQGVFSKAFRIHPFLLKSQVGG